MSLDIDNRMKAMKWWNNLSLEKKYNKMRIVFKDRHPDTLTDREIAGLYYDIVGKLIYVTDKSVLIRTRSKKKIVVPGYKINRIEYLNPNIAELHPIVRVWIKRKYYPFYDDEWLKKQYEYKSQT